MKFVEQNMLSTDLTLNLTQNIPWTGGSLFVETAAQRMDIFSDHTTAWQTSPINIGYRPVSYTHLDVYKRQVLPTLRNAGNIINNTNMTIGLFECE